MKDKFMKIVAFVVIVLIVIITVCLFKIEDKKESELPLEVEKVYDKTGTCYSSNLGSTVLTIKGNSEETVINGIAVKKESTPAWVNDKVGDYTYDNVLKDIKDILNKHTDNDYSLKVEELDSNKTSYRNDSSSYDEYWYRVTFDYIEDNSFNNTISKLENGSDYDTNYYCIINDGISYPGKWEGVGQYTLDTDYDITVVLDDKQGGSFKAVKKIGVQTTFEKLIKYNVLDNKIKVIYYELEDVDGYQYVRFISGDEFIINGNTLNYHEWREETLIKVN